MGSATRYGRTLRANLCEVECGVFYATYADAESGAAVDELTTYQVGSSIGDVKRRIELSALALGYDAVVWAEGTVVPLFATLAKSALRASSRSVIA